ncbi:MAG: hypothetical protein ACYC6Y_19865, partial [Thermoguttaceae bacterium]
DIVEAKVTFDGQNVYFYVRTRQPLSPPAGPSWMLLLIDADSDAKTGWLGYDRIVNREPMRDGQVVLEVNVGNQYAWEAPRQVALAIGKQELEMAVPWEALGRVDALPSIDFKWADNLQQTGHWSDFTLNGDAAPNDRFNYRAKFSR